MFRLFQLCFWVGVLFTFATFILGQFFDFADIDGDIDFDSDLDLDGDVPGYAISPLKPIIITSFITVFGGIGMLMLNRGIDGKLSAIIACVSGFVVSTVIYKFVIVPLYNAQNTSAVSQANLIGKEGKATLIITNSSYGHIIYSIGGNSYSAPAKTIGDEIIHKGEDVVIIKIENNIFYVERKESVQ